MDTNGVALREFQGGPPMTPLSTQVWDSDRILMEWAQKGLKPAYAVLFRRHASSIWRMSYLILHSASAADDASQETFTRGLSRIDTYRGEAHPRTWFSAIALNVCRHILRDRRSGVDLADPQILDHGRPFGHSTSREVLTTVVRREHHAALGEALKELTQPQREAFVLHYIEEMPYENVSAIMGISPGAARILVHRAKATLRACLGPDSPLFVRP